MGYCAMKTVTVITPTIGKPELADAIESIANQTYPTNLLVVVDGPEYKEKTWNSIPTKFPYDIQFNVTPYNTGANGFYGHRIYAAYPHLLNSDYIFFLDEDNWYAPNHVESIINTIEKDNLDFAFSLRGIYSKDGEYLCNDDCESLGKYPIYFTQQNPQYLIDTSSYGFTRDFIQKTCYLWHSGWGGDRRYLALAKHYSPRFECSGEYTLCYRLDGNRGSVTKEFFEQGNQISLQQYKGVYPWRKS